MRMTSAALALAGVSVLAGASASAAAAHPGASGHRQGATHCKNDGHKYILGSSATRHGNKTLFVGTFERFHPCGEDDGYFTNHKKTITLTLTSSTKIKVFKVEEDPSDNETVTAAQFPHAFKHRKAEPFYQYSGSHSAVTKLSEHFVS
jgi:hypothetical protein